MRAANLTGPRTVEIREAQNPSPDSDELLIEIEACGVCATDLHMYRGSLTTDYPVVPGHESVGVVVDAGTDVDGYSPGDRVAINPSVPCNRCRACKAGRENLCRDLTSIGGAARHTVDGAFAEYVRVPAGNVERIGDTDARTAAFAEPIGCCLNGVDRLDLAGGETAVVVGAGAIGLLFVQLLALRGAGRIVVSEPIEERRSAALTAGADHAVDPTETDLARAVSELVGDVDVAVEAVGLPQTIEQAHGLTGPGGRTLVFGVPPEEATVEISPFEVFYEERDLVGSYSLTPDTFARAVTLLRNGRIDVDGLVTDEFGLDGLERAFERMEAGEGLKKVIYPNR